MEEVPSGLRRLMSDWNGSGTLFSALAAAGSSESKLRWTEEQIRARGMRILLLENLDLLRQLPTKEAKWADALPLSSNPDRRWRRSIRGRVNWPKTYTAGWPPQRFYTKVKRRRGDNTLLNILHWVGVELDRIMSKLPIVDGTLSELNLEERQTALREAAGDQVSDGYEPLESELSSAHRMGYPWTALVAVARLLIEYERRGAEYFASRLILPDLEDRIFQLHVLGVVVESVENITGLQMESQGPITGQTGPVYAAAGWAIWWEGSQIWRSLALENVRRAISTELLSVSDVSKAGRPDRPDIIVVGPQWEMLVIECKFPFASNQIGYVVDGVAQAFYYASQLKSRASNISAVAIGPGELIKTRSSRVLGEIEVSVASSVHIQELIAGIACSGPTMGDDGNRRV